MSFMQSVFTVWLGLYGAATQTSIAAMEILSWSLFAMVAGAAAITWRKDQSARVWRIGPDLWLWGYVAVTILSLLLSEVEGAKLEFANKVRWVPLLYSTAWAWARIPSRSYGTLLKVFFAVNAIAAVYSVVQFFFGIELFRSRQIIFSAGSVWRASAFFNLALTFAYVAGMYGYLAAGPLWTAPFRAWFKRDNLWALLGAGAGLTACVTSLTRGSWVAIVFTTGLVLLLVRPKRLIPASALGAVMLTTAILTSEGLRTRLLSIGNTADRTNQHRVLIWKGHWEVFKAHPVLGVGLGASGIVSPDYYERSQGFSEEQAKQFYREIGIVKADFQSHAHNNLLHQASGTGLLGVICFVAFCLFFLRRSWLMAGHSDPRWSAAGLGLFGAQIFFHIGGLTEANFFDGEVNHTLVFLWAMLIGLERRLASENG